MYTPTLSTRTTNVELTKHRLNLLTQKLFPISRLVDKPGKADFDVVIRQETCVHGQTHYFISVKFSTGHSTFMTVAQATKFQKALTQVRASLKQQVVASKKQNYRRRQAESVWRHQLLWT